MNWRSLTRTHCRTCAFALVGLGAMLMGARSSFSQTHQRAPIGSELHSNAEASSRAKVATTSQGTFEVAVSTVGGNTPLYGPCLIVAGPNASGFAGVLGSSCSSVQGSASPPPCSTNLNTSAPTVSLMNRGNGLSEQITLSGQVNLHMAVPPANVADVETVYEACDNSATTSGCFASFNAQTPGSQSSGAANLVTVNLSTVKQLNGGTNPQPVPFGPGQTISLTVTISFTS